MSMLQEFKTFATKGNVIDLAVAVIMGGAFGKITTSLVNDVIMPPIGLLLGDRNFYRLAWELRPATDDHPAVSIAYGLFVQNVVNFLIIAIVMFLLIRGINRVRQFEQRKAEAAPPPPPPPPTKEEQLLTEIRDLLKQQAERS